jgi:transaldolase
MDFFLDTANIDQIKQAQDLGILNGVTTNPSLMLKDGVKKEHLNKHYLEICKIVDGPVSAEVISTDYKEIVKEGDKLSKIHPQIVLKIPMIKDGIKAIKYFHQKGIKTNCTLVFTLGQAILAAKAGASYISPFIGRLEDNNQDGIKLVKTISDFYSFHRYETKILAASIRNTNHITDCAIAGANAITVPLPLLLQLFNHPLTDKGLQKFLDDHKKNNH